MKIEFTLAAFQKERSVTQYLSFIYYLLVFQCIFLVIPINLLNVLMYYPVISYTIPIVGTVLLIILPPLVVVIFNRYLARRTLQNAYKSGSPQEVQDSGWLGSSRSESEYKKSQNQLPFLEREFHWIIALILVSMLGLLMQFLIYMNIFDNSTWFSYLFLNWVQLTTLCIACIAGKRLFTPRRSDLGAFWAGIVIGTIWLFSYINLQAIYLGSALLLAFCGICLFLIKQGFITQHPDFTYTSQKLEYPHFGWVKAASPHRSLVITFGWMCALFWILCFSSLPAILFYGTAVDGTLNLGYLCLVFFIAMACGQKIAEAKLIASPVKGFVVIIFLYGGMMAITEIFIPLKFSIYEQILSGFSLGVLLALRISFKNYNPHHGPTLFYGVSWAILWSTALGWATTLYISLDDDLQFLPGRPLIAAVFGVNILILVVVEVIRGKIMQTKDEQKAKADKLLGELKKPVVSESPTTKEDAWATEPAKSIDIPTMPSTPPSSSPLESISSTKPDIQKENVLISVIPEKDNVVKVDTITSSPIPKEKTSFELKAEPIFSPKNETSPKSPSQDSKTETLQSLKEELIAKADELDAPKININNSQKVKIDLSKLTPKPKNDNLNEKDVFWEDETKPEKNSEKK